MPPVIYDSGDVDVNDNHCNDTEIQSFYRNKAVFLTGGTGFLGKTIMEKLLRSTDVGRIYMLIRNKKGKDINKRFNEIFDEAIFEVLAKEKPKFRSRITIVTGDCTSAGLGICNEDYQMLVDNVNIVIHGAATVRFNETLKMAITINVRGTLEVVELCKSIKNLESFVHVSSAFANCDRINIDEKFYQLNISGLQACQLAECLDSNMLEHLSLKLLQKFPNTYTYTKALAENVIQTLGSHLPVCIFRPGIVVPTYREPITGWIDNMYGPTSILMGVAAGILRVFCININSKAQIVPVDLCANAIITSAWDISSKSENNITHTISSKIPYHIKPPIYNFVPHTENPVYWKCYREYSYDFGHKCPLSRMFWFPCITLIQSKILYKILLCLYHTIPAILGDMALVMMGKKQRLMKIYNKVHTACAALEYFTDNEFVFGMDNVGDLIERQSERDKEMFNFDMKTVDWEKQFHQSFWGIRLYLSKEDASTIPMAIKRYQRLRILHYFTLGVIYSFALYAAHLVLLRPFISS